MAVTSLAHPCNDVFRIARYSPVTHGTGVGRPGLASTVAVRLPSLGCRQWGRERPAFGRGRFFRESSISPGHDSPYRAQHANLSYVARHANLTVPSDFTVPGTRKPKRTLRLA